MRSFLAALFMLVSFTLAATVATAEAHAPRTLPSVSTVLPSAPLAFDAPKGIDWQAHDLAAAAASPRTARTVRTTVEAPKVWTCGAPRGLTSDASATVRTCEWL